MATSLTRGGMFAARRSLASAAATSPAARATGSAAGSALREALNTVDAASGAASTAVRPFSRISCDCGAITRWDGTLFSSPSAPSSHPLAGVSPARRSFGSKRGKLPELTQAEYAAMGAEFDDFEDDLDVASLFKPDLSPRSPPPPSDDDDDGGPVTRPRRGGSSYSSPIGEDYSQMTNDQLADPTTIPGWDLIHCPPRKYPKGALVGKVVSDKMDKTVNVAVDRYRIVPKYRKRRKYTKKFMAHDEGEVCNMGDTVMIVPCQRISKNKHFMVREIIKAKGAL